MRTDARTAGAWGAALLLLAVASPSGAQELVAPSALGATTSNAVTSAVAVNTVEPAIRLRDPFWPVGYVPRPPEPAVATNAASGGTTVPLPISGSPAQRAAVPNWPKLSVRGLGKTPSGESMALVEGVGWAKAGDTLRMTDGAFAYRWLIREVGPRGASIERLDVQPLSRSQ